MCSGDRLEIGASCPMTAFGYATEAEAAERWNLRAALQDKAGEVAVAIDNLHNERRDGMTNVIFPPVQIGTRLFAAQPAPVVPDGFAIVPVEPTVEMLGGLAHGIMLAFDINAKSPALLINVLTNLGHEIPQWLRDEIKDPESNHVLSKGTRAVIIYRAMLAASQQKQTIFEPCCDKEDRTLSGGCRNCGDPCL